MEYFKDWFLELKLKIILLDLKSIKRINDIFFIIKECPYLLKDENLCESYHKLVKINKINNDTLKELVNSINFLEALPITFSKEDIKDIYEILEEDFKLQDSFCLNIIKYITIVEKNSMSYDEMMDEMDKYIECDVCCFNQIKINNQEIKKLIKELKEGEYNNEQN